jgi:hypothetical protein
MTSHGGVCRQDPAWRKAIPVEQPSKFDLVWNAESLKLSTRTFSSTHPQARPTRWPACKRLKALASCSSVVSITGADEDGVLAWHAISPTRNLTVRGANRGRCSSEDGESQQGAHNRSHDHSPPSVSIHLIQKIAAYACNSRLLTVD